MVEMFRTMKNLYGMAIIGQNDSLRNIRVDSRGFLRTV